MVKPYIPNVHKRQASLFLELLSKQLEAGQSSIFMEWSADPYERCRNGLNL
jgi:hypothetical protein